jgi:hypothetical protein
MRGHAPLIAMRMQHRKPSGWVCITLGTDDRSWLADNWPGMVGTGPFIAIGAAESIDRLDLRFVIGLEVVVDGDVSQADRVWQTFEACIRAGASRTLGAVMCDRANGELETVEHRDSKGVLVWPE